MASSSTQTISAYSVSISRPLSFSVGVVVAGEQRAPSGPAATATSSAPSSLRQGEAWARLGLQNISRPSNQAISAKPMSNNSMPSTSSASTVGWSSAKLTTATSISTTMPSQRMCR